MASSSVQAAHHLGELHKNDLINAKTTEDYLNLFSDKASAEDRKEHYEDVVNGYYNLATDFYEYGWGQSFHFAHRYKNESHEASLARHEYFLALKVKANKGMKILDLGCGVGGPARSIARFSGASVIGLNNNAYQIGKGNAWNERMKLSHLVTLKKGDFMKMPLEDNSMDAVYQIEATCHAPDPVALYKQIFRVMKPGALFGSYEWIMTDKYNPDSEEHRTIKHGIEVGDGLPDLRTAADVLNALREAGFEIVEAEDIAPTAEIPWYEPLSSSFSPKGFLKSGLGRWATSQLVRVLEFVRLAPSGSSKVQDFLQTAASALVAGGKQEIFTPMFWTLVRKPLDAAQ